MQTYNAVVRNSTTGAAQPGTSVSVLNDDQQTLATIYEVDGITPLANPFDTDMLGRAQFAAPDGTYYVQVNTASGPVTDKIVLSSGGGGGGSGTVTSVALNVTAPAPFSANVTNSPITTNGTINVTITLTLGAGQIIVGKSNGSSQAVSLSGAVTMDQNGIVTLASNLLLPGVPTCATAAAGTNSLAIANTAFVTAAIASAIVGVLDDRGGFDASGNAYPASGGRGVGGLPIKGDLWTITVAGTLGGQAVVPGDVVRALVDTPGQNSVNWLVTEGNLGYAPVSSANMTQYAVAIGGTGTSQSWVTLGANQFLIGQAGANPIAASASQVKTILGLAAVASSGSASDISTGTLADARLSANIPLLNAANIYLQQQGAKVAYGTAVGAVTLNLSALASSGGITWTDSSGNPATPPTTSNKIILKPSGAITGITLSGGVDGVSTMLGLCGTGGFAMAAPSGSNVDYGAVGAPTLNVNKNNMLALDYYAGIGTGTFEIAVRPG